MKSNKERIVNAFSKSAEYYSEHAGLQKEVAAQLARALEPWQYSLPDGPVIEVGAGTGFFSRYLAELFPKREITISDLSRQMLNHCRQTIGERPGLHYEVIDAEEMEWQNSSFSLIAGNYVVQWFKEPSVTLSRMIEALKPGGFMLFSFPGNESFPKWRKYCLELGIPFTANPLPDIEQVVLNLSMGPVKVDYYEDQNSETFQNLFEFFRHMKRCGIYVNIKENKLSPSQLRHLNNYWIEQNNGQVHVHYHTAFIAVKKDL